MTEMNKNNHGGSSSSSSSSSSAPSNERLLCTAFVSFCTFALVQAFVAMIAGSEAMLADTAAMLVDAITYLFNWYAERQKQYYGEKLNTQKVDCKSSLLYRKYTLQLEIVPPLFSVSILLIVTGFVMNQAIEVLILDIGTSGRDQSLQADPNVHLMMLFSILNLFLDFMNVFCFARAKHALGYNTVSTSDDSSIDRQKVKITRSLLSNNSHNDNKGDDGGDDDDDDSCGDVDSDYKDNAEETGEDSTKTTKTSTKKKSKMEHFEIDQNDTSSPLKDTDHHHSDDDGSNLNMCSAYTHVFADTLRSIAVIFASTLAEFHPRITSEEADAGAAVVVSILIALSLIPLLTGMVQTIRSLRRVNILIEEQHLMEKTSRGDDDDDFGEEDDWT